jgi:hypothetical protein
LEVFFLCVFAPLRALRETTNNKQQTPNNNYHEKTNHHLNLTFNQSGFICSSPTSHFLPSGNPQQQWQRAFEPIGKSAF